MRRWALICVPLLLLGPTAIIEARPHAQQVTHSCTAIDRSFVNDARAGIETFRLDGTDRAYAVPDARTAAAALRRTAPSDPSLRQARLLLSAMLIEYAKGHSGRFALLMGEARSVLADAAAPLHGLGCDVDALL